MPFVEISQILVVLCFLGLLFAVQQYVRRNRDGLRSRLATQKRLHLIEVLSVGTGERLLLVGLDGRECLVHSARGGSSIMMVNGSLEAQECSGH